MAIVIGKLPVRLYFYTPKRSSFGDACDGSLQLQACLCTPSSSRYRIDNLSASLMRRLTVDASWGFIESRECWTARSIEPT